MVYDAVPCFDGCIGEVEFKAQLFLQCSDFDHGQWVLCAWQCEAPRLKYGDTQVLRVPYIQRSVAP